MSGSDTGPAGAAGDTGDDEVVLDRLKRAAACFGEQLLAVGDEEWDLPTPCADWDVRSLVAHVVVGDAQVPRVLAGDATEATPEVDVTVLGHSPVSVWRGTAVAALAAFAEPGVLDRRHPHPVGRVTGRTVAGFRLTDHLVHAWDLARALGRDLELPPDLVDAALDFWLPRVDDLAPSGHFGEGPQQPPPDATPTQRLVALLGRRP